MPHLNLSKIFWRAHLATWPVPASCRTTVRHPTFLGETGHQQRAPAGYWSRREQPTGAPMSVLLARTPTTPPCRGRLQLFHCREVIADGAARETPVLPVHAADDKIRHQLVTPALKIVSRSSCSAWRVASAPTRPARSCWPSCTPGGRWVRHRQLVPFTASHAAGGCRRGPLRRCRRQV